jgi:flagellar basal body-associated protein FliL
MVSNDEIKERFKEQRAGTNIKEYLVCNTCQGVYELQSGEKPEDFSDECECGGKLTYSKNISNNEVNEPTKTSKMVRNGLIIFVVLLGLIIFIAPLAYIGINAMTVSHTTNEGSGSAYDQLAVLKSDYNSLNDQFTNVQTSVDNSNNKNAKTAFMNAKLELVKANSDINDVESALSAGKSSDEVTQTINTAQAQLNQAKSSLSNVKTMI